LQARSETEDDAYQDFISKYGDGRGSRLGNTKQGAEKHQKQACGMAYFTLACRLDYFRVAYLSPAIVAGCIEYGTPCHFASFRIA
jgi:hypothetical protein